MLFLCLKSPIDIERIKTKLLKNIEKVSWKSTVTASSLIEGAHFMGGILRSAVTVEPTQRCPDSVLQVFQEERTFRFALRLTRNRDDAEDVISDALLKAWASKGLRNQDSAKAFSWACSIIVNVVRDRYPKNKQRLANLPFDDARLKPHELTTQSLDKYLLMDHIWTAYTRLPQPYQQIIRLRIIEGRSTKEAAQMIHRQPGTTKSRLHRALVFLRTRLR